MIYLRKAMSRVMQIDFFMKYLFLCVIFYQWIDIYTNIILYIQIILNKKINLDMEQLNNDVQHKMWDVITIILIISKIIETH